MCEYLAMLTSHEQAYCIHHHIPNFRNTVLFGDVLVGPNQLAILPAGVLRRRPFASFAFGV